MVRSAVCRPPNNHDIHIVPTDSFPSMAMTYYTEKALKKQARKQCRAGAQSKG